MRKSENQIFSNNRETKQFKKMEERCLDAWKTLKPKNAAKFYAKDPDLEFFDFAPLKFTGWTEYQTKDLSNLKKLTIKLHDDFKTIRKEDMVVTMVTFDFTLYPKKGKQVTAKARHTVLWMKKGRKWLIFHEHYSSPAE